MKPEPLTLRILPALLGLVLLALVLGLQLQLNLVPCPLCILQRIVWLAIIAVSVICTLGHRHIPLRWQATLLGLLALAGAGVAARESWLQWFPPQAASCGRDFGGLLETFPLSQALSLMFRGSGDCTQVDWTLLGASMANWSCMVFVMTAAYAVWLWRRPRRHSVF